MKEIEVGSDPKSRHFGKVTHDCGLLDCEVALDGEARYDVEVFDGLSGRSLLNVNAGDSLPTLEELLNGLHLLKGDDLPRPFTRRKVA